MDGFLIVRSLIFVKSTEIIKVGVRAMLSKGDVLRGVFLVHLFAIAVLAVNGFDTLQRIEYWFAIIEAVSEGVIMHLQNLEFWQTA